MFVPLPIAVDDHQTANAKFLANVGAAKICQQAEMTPAVLDELLATLLNRQLLSEMQSKHVNKHNRMQLSMWLI